MLHSNLFLSQQIIYLYRQFICFIIALNVIIIIYCSMFSAGHGSALFSFILLMSSHHMKCYCLFQQKKKENIAIETHICLLWYFLISHSAGGEYFICYLLCALLPTFRIIRISFCFQCFYHAPILLHILYVYKSLST